MDNRECMTVILEKEKTKDVSPKIIPSLLLGIILSNVKRKRKKKPQAKGKLYHIKILMQITEDHQKW